MKNNRQELRYTGPLAECGFTGPETGTGYLARAGGLLAVDAADVPGLLRRHGDVLQEVKVARAARKVEPEAVVTEDADAEAENAAAEEGDDGTDGSQDAA